MALQEHYKLAGFSSKKIQLEWWWSQNLDHIPYFHPSLSCVKFVFHVKRSHEVSIPIEFSNQLAVSLFIFSYMASRVSIFMAYSISSFKFQRAAIFPWEHFLVLGENLTQDHYSALVIYGWVKLYGLNNFNKYTPLNNNFFRFSIFSLCRPAVPLPLLRCAELPHSDFNNSTSCWVMYRSEREWIIVNCSTNLGSFSHLKRNFSYHSVHASSGELTCIFS